MSFKKYFLLMFTIISCAFHFDKNRIIEQEEKEIIRQNLFFLLEQENTIKIIPNNGFNTNRGFNFYLNKNGERKAYRDFKEYFSFKTNELVILLKTLREEEIENITSIEIDNLFSLNGERYPLISITNLKKYYITKPKLITNENQSLFFIICNNRIATLESVTNLKLYTNINSYEIRASTNIRQKIFTNLSVLSMIEGLFVLKLEDKRQNLVENIKEHRAVANPIDKNYFYIDIPVLFKTNFTTELDKNTEEEILGYSFMKLRITNSPIIINSLISISYLTKGQTRFYTNYDELCIELLSDNNTTETIEINVTNYYIDRTDIFTKRFKILPFIYNPVIITNDDNFRFKGLSNLNEIYIYSNEVIIDYRLEIETNENLSLDFIIFPKNTTEITTVKYKIF